MNPIANTPVFLGLVEGMSKERKRRIAAKACITAFVIVTVFIVAGKYIFELFGITVPAFKIAGGILIFYVGFEMLLSQKSKVHNVSAGEEEQAASDNDLAVSPLGIPIMAGPGTIVTAMNYISEVSYLHLVLVVLTFGVMVLLNYAAFVSSEFLVKKIGTTIIAAIGKIMGLILAIIGVGMVIAGVDLLNG